MIQVQHTPNSREMAPLELAAELSKRGVELETLKIPKVSLERVTRRTKRFLGMFGVREIVEYETTTSIEAVDVWRVHPQSLLDTEDLFERFLSPDGRVFEADIDEFATHFTIRDVTHKPDLGDDYDEYEY